MTDVNMKIFSCRRRLAVAMSLLVVMLSSMADGFAIVGQQQPSKLVVKATKEASKSKKVSSMDENDNVSKKDNKAMAFLRKIGKVGGAMDLTSSVGVDEGVVGSSGGGKPLRKCKTAYPSCVETGIMDDLSEPFPMTACGTKWTGITDQVMGGISSGSLSRELAFHGRKANVLHGKVRLANNAGFVQMAADLSTMYEHVDASDYDGIELEVLCCPPPLHHDNNEDGASAQPLVKEQFNVHLKNAVCERPFSSYRATFELTRGDSQWSTVRLPWSDFAGHGPGAEDTTLDISTLRRIGIVAIGREMDVELAVSAVRFYTVI